MTTDQLITPTPELVRKWTQYRNTDCPEQFWWHIATQAARWGADEQLKMDANWVTLQMSNQMSAKRLKAEMRPKPPTLKEQALEALDKSIDLAMYEREYDTIRRALEQLDD